MTAHILLNDISATDNCMLYAKGSHRTHREYITDIDYYYSEEYMTDNFEIVPCVGDSGTLVIFDSNGLHRVDLKPQTFRSHLHLNFVPGNDFLKKPSKTEPINVATLAEVRKLQRYQERSLMQLLS
jgi:hypothetical protein